MEPHADSNAAEHADQREPGGQKGLPTYLVLDTSGSMKDFEHLLNSTLTEVVDTLYASPRVAEFIHLSIVSFNTRPHVVLPMTDISQLTGLPVVECRGTTVYGAMFDLLRDQIEGDIGNLRSNGVRAYRPVVFLLTDGIPSDGAAWRSSFAALRDPGWRPRPNLITYGFGGASEAILEEVSTLAAYIAEPGREAENKKALSSALTSVMQTLVASASVQRLQVPHEVEGYKSVPLETVD
ncbi:VWA domain-containing protein [Spirillospora sp. NPDC048819]|uniref:vWA domain-containing protein n=1 Tax=Spirillospora sp. NPDC048819 TaxID=3155268 RepID=UPI0033F664F2